MPRQVDADIKERPLPARVRRGCKAVAQQSDAKIAEDTCLESQPQMLTAESTVTRQV